MSARSTRLNDPSVLLASTRATLFTVPAGKRAIIKSLYAYTTSTTGASFVLFAGDGTEPLGVYAVKALSNADTTDKDTFVVAHEGEQVDALMNNLPGTTVDGIGLIICHGMLVDA